MRGGWVIVGAAAMLLLWGAAALRGQRAREERRREVDDAWARANPLSPGEFEIRAFGPDGLPVPRGWIRVAEVRPDGGGAGGGPGTFGGVERARISPRDGDSALWIEFLRPADRRDRPLPFGAVLLPRLPWDRPRIEIRLPPEREVEGIVLDPEGNPLPGVVVRADPDLPVEVAERFDDFRNGYHGATTTGADGRFRIGQLGDMDYRTTAKLPPDLPAEEPVRVRAGTKGIEIRSGRNPPPLVTVVDAEGNPVAGVEVMAEESAPVAGPGSPERPVRPLGITSSGKTDARGRAWLPGLDRGRRYLLRTMGTSTFAMEVREGWTPRDERIVLSRPGSPSGR